MQLNKTAPIVLFVYNRPQHTLNCLQSLQENVLAAESTLYVFCDGPKKDATTEQLKGIAEVQEIVSAFKGCGKIVIHKQLENRGLRNSIITGVTSVINEHGKAIVLEDDLILSKYFLEYMNEGLSRYENEHKVGQISGFSFQLNVSKQKEESYFLPLTTTWGWATWKRVWNEVDFNGEDAKTILSDKAAISRFNLDNSFDYYGMLQKQLNAHATISSWGIMFWLDAFKRGYITLFPKYSLTTNTGFDGTGMHKANNTNDQQNDFRPDNRATTFPEAISVNHDLFAALKRKLYRQEYSWKKRLVRLYNKWMK